MKQKFNWRLICAAMMSVLSVVTFLKPAFAEEISAISIDRVTSGDIMSPVMTAFHELEKENPEIEISQSYGEYLETGNVVELIASMIGKSKTVRHDVSLFAYNLIEDGEAVGVTELDNDLIRATKLALHARTLSRMSILSDGYAGKIETAILEILNDHPESELASTLYGCWNFEIVRLAGWPLHKTFGASRKKGKERFELAMSYKSDEAIVPFAYSVFLASDNTKKHSDYAIDLLEDADERAARNPSRVNTLIAEQAHILKQYLVAGDFKAAENFALSVL